MTQSRLDALYDVLQHRFKQPALLTEALTHPSVDTSRQAGRDYDRLEFLGDRVLGLIVSSRLFARFPEADAGDLAVRFNALVRKETVAEVATAIDLGDYLRLSKSESQGGGRAKPAILANALEAVIGALYLDGGLPAAEAFVDVHWSERVNQTSHAMKDAKTRLQEWAQKDAMAPPTYNIVAQSGPPHDPVFTVEVHVGDRPPMQAEGKSRRAAEQAVATAMLATLDLDD